MASMSRVKEEGGRTLVVVVVVVVVVVMVVVVVAFFSLARIFGNVRTSRAFFPFKVEIRVRSVIPIFMPGSVHSGSAS